MKREHFGPTPQVSGQKLASLRVRHLSRKCLHQSVWEKVAFSEGLRLLCQLGALATKRTILSDSLSERARCRSPVDPNSSTLHLEATFCRRENDHVRPLWAVSAKVSCTLAELAPTRQRNTQRCQWKVLYQENFPIGRMFVHYFTGHLDRKSHLAPTRWRKLDVV